jgi:LAO/AO transport system kinase
MRNRLSREAYIEGILSGNRMVLARAITLVESRLPSDQDLAAEVLQGVLPVPQTTLRIGITGVPGVGKSTFIESFGTWLTRQNLKIAVLAIDPSSQVSGGSILGDKTRMEELSKNPMAFIRPSATGLNLGGVARKTRETMLLCEAAGYEVILIETVGVGQSETLVKEMTDFFLLLMLAGAGDELQGIKKGIMEMADALAITKADGGNQSKAQLAQIEYQNALHLFPLAENGWSPPVLTCSALNGEGLEDIWEMVSDFRKKMTESGYFLTQRSQQNVAWMHDQIRQNLEDSFYQNVRIKPEIVRLQKAVAMGQVLPQQAAEALLHLFIDKIKTSWK